MAEAFAIAAGVIAVIQITDRVADICRFYIESVQDCPSELRVILSETFMLKILFEHLQSFLNANTRSNVLGSLEGKNGPIKGCESSMTALELLFPRDTSQTQSHQGSKKKRKLTAALATLAWPFKEKKAKKLLEEINQHKSTISLVLATESLQDIRYIKRKTDNIHDMLSETQRYQVCQWLQKTDPSPLHNRACSLYEPGTGDWVLRSPEWTDWITAKHRCLWIHGIPGAGKTILMSHLVQHVKEYCKDIPRTAHAYYCCYFGHDQDEAAHFLGSLLNQLCRQSNLVIPTIYNMYKAGGEPNLLELLEALQEMLIHFDTVYVVVDALDESLPRDNLLKVLRDLVTDLQFQKIQVLASSREYIDIETTMEAISVAVSMSNPFVEEDIRSLVRSLIASNHRFSRWPRDMLDELENAVATGAHGMFRWAVCQIDTVQRFKCDRRIIKATLADLPRTLDQTYDRLLLAIPDDEKLFVWHALHWISVHSTLYYKFEMPLVILSRAAEASAARAVKQPNNRFYDCETLRDFCSCLIHVNIKTEGVTFAHYTVQEYLYRTHVFQEVWEKLNHPFFLDFMCTETLRTRQEDLNTQKYDFQHKDFAIDAQLNGNLHIYCAISSMISLNRGTNKIEQRNVSLVVDLLDPSKGHIRALRRLLKIVFVGFAEWDALIDHTEHLWSVEWDPDVDIYNLGVMHLLNIVFAVSDATEILVLVEHVLRNKSLRSGVFAAELALKFPAYRDNSTRDQICGTIINILPQLCLRRNLSRSLAVFNYLLQQDLVKGCDIAIYIAAHDHPAYCQDFCALEHMLSTGGDPNGFGYRITPLQIAVYTLDMHDVNTLLRARADPNGTGDRNGRVWKDNEVLSFYNDLEGKSPLRISRGRRDLKYRSPNSKVLNEKDMPRIESALLQHGARDFKDELEEISKVTSEKDYVNRL